MNRIGKINRGRAGRHGFHIPFRSKHVDLIMVEIELESLHKFSRRIGILDQLPGPAQKRINVGIIP